VSSDLPTVLVSSGITALVAIAGFWNASSVSKRRLDAEERRNFADRKAAAYENATVFLLYAKPSASTS
jgi:hypothetical protein